MFSLTRQLSVVIKFTLGVVVATTAVVLMIPFVASASLYNLPKKSMVAKSGSISRAGYKCPRKYRLIRFLDDEFACKRRRSYKRPRCVSGYVADGEAWRCVLETSSTDQQQTADTGLTAEAINGQLLRGVIEYAKSSGAGYVNLPVPVSDYGSVYAWGMRESDCGMVNAGIARCHVFLWVERYLRDRDFRLFLHREVYRYQAFATYAGAQGNTVYANYSDNYGYEMFLNPFKIICSNAVPGYPACS